MSKGKWYIGLAEYSVKKEMISMTDAVFQFHLEAFIAKYVTRRNVSMFRTDIDRNRKKLLEKIKKKKVLVIGGAGSIGSSFIRTLLAFEPGELVVVDVNENALAELTRDLRSTGGEFIPEQYVTYPVDYASDIFRKIVVNRGGFDIVANFSAHKHVRSEKDIYSVEALIRNNVLHVKELLDLLVHFPPEVYFCVSTDKAANPVSIMGASKRIMEDVIFSYSDEFPVKTARFANVAFSNGSLPEGFLKRIARLQPLSAPSDVKRYFVSPEESGQICLLACMLGNNREIFFPRLEKRQMMSFSSIAEELLHVHGYQVHICGSDEEAVEMAEDLKKGSREYPVHFSQSDTSGEKTYEEFYTDREETDMERFQSLGVIVGKKLPDQKILGQFLDSLDAAFDRDTVTKEDIVSILSGYLPGFRHIEKGKSLDGKM